MAQNKQTGQLKLRNFDNLHTLENKQRFYNIVLKPEGADIFKRYYPLLNYIKQSQSDDLYMENRGLLSSPINVSKASDEHNNEYQGSNFASNNYLGLSTHPSTIQGGSEAARQFGVNSAGSPLAFGATKYYGQLRDEIGQFWKCKSLIYSAGWMAGFGVIKGMIREYDHIIIDQFADNSLMQGSFAATKNTHKFRHLDQKHMAQILTSIRSKDKQNSILVVTEALFPNDSCSPNLNNYQKIAKQNKAALVISCFHDFGIFGESGKGIWEQQNLQDRQNVMLLGTGSKTVSINFGFIGCTHRDIVQYMKYFSTAYMFTNAINPVQANGALFALRVIKSHQGKILRTQLLQNSSYLRKKFQEKGYKPLGRASGFICIEVGNEVLSRMIVRILMDNNILANNVEYPLVPAGKAIMRFSLMPNHNIQQLNNLVHKFDIIYKHANKFVEKKREKLAKL